MQRGLVVCSISAMDQSILLSTFALRILTHDLKEIIGKLVLIACSLTQYFEFC